MVSKVCKMKTVHKFTVPGIGHPFLIETRAGAEVLTAQMQGKQFVFWMRVDESQPVARLQFVAIGTGHPDYWNGKYVATVQDCNFVWHLFQL